VKPQEKASLTIRFRTPADLLMWVEHLKARGEVQPEMEVVATDGLDDRATQIPDVNRFILAKDRPNKLRFSNKVTDHIHIEP